MTPAQPPTPATFHVHTPTDLVAVVPVMLGFHPRDSVVLLTFGAAGTSFHARVDLPVARAEQEEVADVLLGAVVSNRAERVAVLLYTEDVEVAQSQFELLLGRLLDRGIEIIDVLRVDDGRWHSLPEDGSPGTAYDLGVHAFTALGVFEGQVVHRDRAELADTLVGTDEDDALAVALAATRYAVHLESSEEPDLLRNEARWLQGLIRSLRIGKRIEPVVAGRVLVLASLVPIRDVAWAEITQASSRLHVELWRGLVRRAPRDLLPGACSLLAFAAWQQGNGALAWCAIDRCLEVDPDYSMAHCIAQLLTGAVPPDVWEPIPEDQLPVFAGGGARGQNRSRAS
jgi:uncharacterized protein DUF4192